MGDVMVAGRSWMKLVAVGLLSSSAARAEPAVEEPPHAPTPAPARRSTVRHGVTFELDVGVGHARGFRLSDTSFTAFGVGVGGWIRPDLVLSFRAGGILGRDRPDYLSGPGVVYVGPSLNYWVNDSLWLGGGVGLASISAATGQESISTGGWGLQLRVGVKLVKLGDHTLNLSVEGTIGIASERPHTTIGGAAVLIGYRYL